MKPIWEVPLLVLAGVFAIAGIAMTFAVGAREPWPIVEWALAAASITFTCGRMWHVRSTSRRELELIVLASAVFVALYKGPIALGITIGAILMLALDAKPKAASGSKD